MKIKDHYYSQETFDVLPSENGVFKTQNIPTDLEKYYDSERYISYENPKKNLVDHLYDKVQQWNFNYKFKILKKYSTNGKVLDYGCGSGAFLNYLSEKSSYQLYGYEPINTPTLSENIKIYADLNDSQEKFDIIMLWHVFEHIENREEILLQLRNKLSPNGVLIIALPNYTSWDAKIFKNHWAAWDVPRHIFHYSKKGAIEYFTRKEHFYLDRIYPLPFDSYYISLMSAKYRNSLIYKLLSPFIASLSNVFALFNNQYSSLIYVLKNTN